MIDTQKIRQLERHLADCDGASEANLTQKIDLLNDLAWALGDIDLKRAQSLGETAYTLATSANDDAPPYPIGMAYSLRTLGYLNQRLGDYSLGLTQLLRAQELCESLQLDDGLTDVLDGIAGIYFQIGNFPEALNYIYKQLEAAQRLGDKRLIANAYNNLANIYFETGDYDRAIETLHHNLQLAAEIDYQRIEALSYLNLTEAHLLAGDYEPALENARRGLSVSQAAGFELFEVYAFDFIGKSYLKLGEVTQAIHYLEQALALSRKVESKVTESLILLNLGQAYRATQQLDLALDYLQQAIATAQLINANSELFKGHLLLSEIFEQQGDFTQALHHFKQHHVFKELVFGEKADERLKVLQIAHDTETARNQAEIFQLKTFELQREVNERISAEAQLQRQFEVVRALSACSQTLLATAKSKVDNQRLLAEALQHLIEPAQVSKVFLYENFDDPNLGFCSRFIVDACAPGIPSAREDPKSAVIPWSIAPVENRRRLAAGEPVGGPVKELFAATPPFRDYLLDELHVLSVQFFPIHFGDFWWGYVGFDDRVNERQWRDEEILLLGTAAEMLSNTLQRWQAEENLRAINDRLEQQVKVRTTELSDTIELLQEEIKEREQAEAETQLVLASLEQRVAARTQELSTFFDLTVLAGRAANLDSVFQQAVPRILEATRSRAICIHLFDADHTGLYLAAQQNLPGDDHPRLQTVALLPDFRRWLQQPNDPLVTTNLTTLDILPSAFRLPEFQTYLGAQIRIGDQIEGVLSCYRFTGRGFGLDEISLVVALAEQMGMLLETHRLRQTAEEMAVLEERQRLARDLHDSVTQSIYGLTLFARSGRQAAEDGDLTRLTASLAELEANSLHALREMRLLLYELLPLELENEGLVRALDLRFNTVERRAGLSVNFQAAPDLRFPSAVELELYHLIIEALNNTLKHAQATEVAIRLAADDSRVRLVVADNGCGFDPQPAPVGLGLKNMHERVERLGGSLTILSAPGAGTQIMVEFDRPDTVE